MDDFKNKYLNVYYSNFSNIIIRRWSQNEFRTLKFRFIRIVRNYERITSIFIEIFSYLETKRLYILLIIFGTLTLRFVTSPTCFTRVTIFWPVETLTHFTWNLLHYSMNPYFTKEHVLLETQFLFNNTLCI